MIKINLCVFLILISNFSFGQNKSIEFMELRCNGKYVHRNVLYPEFNRDRLNFGMNFKIKESKIYQTDHTDGYVLLGIDEEGMKCDYDDTIITCKSYKKFDKWMETIKSINIKRKNGVITTKDTTLYHYPGGSEGKHETTYVGTCDKQVNKI